MTKKGLIAVLLALLTALTPVFAFGASVGDYTLDSPYKNVDWSTRRAYKTGLHTHSSVSDGSETYRNMIYAAYEQNYDILSFSEHGITGRAWDKTPFIRPLYLYSYLLGYDKKPLTSAEFAALSDGSAALGSTGEARGKGMFCLTGSNELNGVTVTKSHVNGYFLPENVGNMDWGFENGYDYALSLVEKYGGVSHINHPGDWTGTVWDDEKGEFNAESVDLLTDRLLRYPSCLGVEAVNGFTSLTPHDRVMWDSLLTRCLPYGKTVYGFAGSDAHTIGRLNSCFMYFMLDEVSNESIRSCMENGEFFGATHTVISSGAIGPEQDVHAPDGVDQPLAEVNSLTTEGHRITLCAENADYVQWIANGRIIAKQSLESGTAVLDLDTVDTADMLYVRCEIYNVNGMVFSQPIVLDRGTAPLKYEPATTAAQKLEFALRSTRAYVIVKALVDLIADSINK